MMTVEQVQAERLAVALERAEEWKRRSTYRPGGGGGSMMRRVLAMTYARAGLDKWARDIVALDCMARRMDVA